MIWVDLEAGDYTIQILSFRQPVDQQTSFYENVYFQLYIRYEAENVSREVFLPRSLNYHGLLGVADETHDFGHVTLFWDDLTLFSNHISTDFYVESHMASVSIQLEQAGEQVEMRLTQWVEEDQRWEAPEQAAAYPTLTDAGRIDTVEAFGLQTSETYRLELFKTAYGEHDHIEDIEVGEHLDIQFSLKIDFSEFDDSSVSDNLNHDYEEFLPFSLYQIAKTKRSMLGLHEKAFTIGNRHIVHLIEYGDGYESTEIIPSYVPKDKRIFTAQATEEQVVLSLPFNVEGIGEVFYAGIYEYTQGVNQMSLHIYRDETHEEVAVSRQGKHYSLISDVFLDEGKYHFVIKNDRAQVLGSAR